MGLGSLALGVVISVALVVVGKAEPFGGFEKDEDKADDDEEEDGKHDAHNHPYCLPSQRVPVQAEESHIAICDAWMHINSSLSFGRSYCSPQRKPLLRLLSAVHPHLSIKRRRRSDMIGLETIR